MSDTLFGMYDDQDRMLAYGDAVFSYTSNGSLQWKVENGDTTWYDYDLLGNLLSVKLPDETLIEYIIDGQNRRVGKVVNGQFKKGWLYQDQLNPVAELDSTGQIAARFVYGSKAHVPDYIIRSDSTYRVITDHLGSVRLIVNTETGSIAQQLLYDEFGNVLLNTAPDFQPFAFAGGLYDSQTGLVRFGARDYDAGVGRWMAKDPIGFRGEDLNLYNYVENDPINWIDPLGWIKFKKDISDDDVNDVIKNKYDVIDAVFKKHKVPEPTITSTTGDKHKKGSKHYEGKAIDIRGKHISDTLMKTIADELQKELGCDYDVVPEFFPDKPDWDHIHIEYDPK